MLRTGVVQVGAERTTIFAAVDSNQMERIIIEVKKTSYGGGYLNGCSNYTPALHTAYGGNAAESAVDGFSPTLPSFSL